MLNRNKIYASFLCILTMASPSWCGESGVVPTIVADASNSEMQEGVKAAFRRFVSSQNDRDPSVLSNVLVKSRSRAGRLPPFDVSKCRPVSGHSYAV